MNLATFASKHALALLLIAGVTILVYGNSLSNSFHFDDEHSLVGNPYIRNLSNIPDFFSSPTMFSRNVGSGMYRPLVLASYAVNYWLGGYQVRGYHLINIGIHLLVAWLVYGVFRELEFGRNPALLGAMFFGVHPLTAEPVNYISSRSESMAGLFYLGSLLFYLRSHGKVSSGSLLCFVAGLLSKSIVLTLPLLLAAYEGIWRCRPWRDWGRWHWPYWMLALIYLLGTRQLVGEALLGKPVRSWTAQLSTQAKGVIYYAKMLAFPWPLNVEHQFFESNGWLEGPVWIAGALLVSLGWIIGRGLKRKARSGLFWIVWMIIALLPTLIVPLNVLVNERRLYLPLIGFTGFLLWLLQVRKEWPGRGLALFGIGLVCLGGMTIQRNPAWRSEMTLWEDARQKSPLMARPYLRLGGVHRRAGRLEEAERAYRRVLELEPDSAPAFNNLGNLYQEKGELAKAEQAYRRALEILPSYPEALVNLATFFSRQDRVPAALELYRQAIVLSPNREEIFNNMGTALLGAGRFAEAEEVLRRALDLNSAAPGIWFNLGGALEGQGRDDEAIQAYEKAIGIDTAYAKAYYNLAQIFERRGSLRDGERAYRNFIRYWDGDVRFAEQARQRLQELEKDGP